MENSAQEIQGEVDKGNILAKIAAKGQESTDSTDQQDKPGPSIPMPTISDIIDYLKENEDARSQLKAGIKKELKLSGWKFRIFESYFDTYFGTTENAAGESQQNNQKQQGQQKKSKYKSLDEHLEVEDYWSLAKMAYDHRKAGHSFNWIGEAMLIHPRKVQDLILAYGERESNKPLKKILRFFKRSN